jgi:hypothetical protein
MKNLHSIFSSVFIALIFSVMAFGQPIIFQDDFEGYVAGVQLTLQNATDWTTWNGVPGDPVTDPYVSTDFAASGVNSILIVTNNDLVHPIANYTTGKYSVRFKMYIPTGFDGYFNTLQEFLGPSTVNWGMQVYFYAGGTGNIDGGAALAQPFTFTHDTWMDVEVIVDHDNDWAEFHLNSTLIHGWQWSLGTFGTPQINQLGGSNFYGHDDPSTVEPAKYYFDDYVLEDLLWIPVELTSFTANVNTNGDVVLNWETASEINNQMFEIERKAENSEYITIGYVNGYGTTTEPQEYSYVDENVETGIYFYRLKQIDFQGTYEYSDVIELDVKGPSHFALGQNYPNPFNPSTQIEFRIPEAGFVNLAVYNLVGEQVALLVNGQVEAGVHEVTFNSNNLPSGAYFYKLQSGSKVELKKMLLTK